MKIRKIRITSGLVALALVASIPLATVAFAAPAAVSANISGDPVAPGRQATLSFRISPTQRTLASFTLAPPLNWKLVNDSSSLGSVTNKQLVVEGLSVSPSSSVTVTFDVMTGCKSGDWDWTLVEALDSQGRTYDTTATSDLSTNVNDNCTLGFVEHKHPTDALKGKLITGTAFDATTNYVAVELLNGAVPPQRVIDFPVDVSFNLATGPGLASAVGFNPATKTTVNGVATFSGSDDTLSIGTANEPQFTDYRLHPITVNSYAGLPGSDSNGFDVWGAHCSGSGCTAELRGGRDKYVTTANTVLTASTLPSIAVAISCPGQRLIFKDNVFVHETNGADAVFVTSTITAQDFRSAGTNYGQAHVEWCVGIKPDDTRALSNGGSYTPVDVNGDQVIDFYVGFAPPCPTKSPALSAPCIASQSSDGMKGSITTGYLQGGDPPRRT